MTVQLLFQSNMFTLFSEILVSKFRLNLKNVSFKHLIVENKQFGCHSIKVE